MYTSLWNSQKQFSPLVANLLLKFGYESIINIRPSANNRSMEIQDVILRDRIDQIVKSLLGGVSWQ